MSARIIERGRGPEIEGTRITVYTIMDYVREGDRIARIAEDLRITPEQVKVALEYIGSHWDEVNSVYDQLLERDRQGNPPWVKALLARTPEELKERIRRRQAERVAAASMKRGVSLEAAGAAKRRAAQVFSRLVGDAVAVGITRVGDDGFGLKVNLPSDPGATSSGRRRSRVCRFRWRLSAGFASSEAFALRLVPTCPVAICRLIWHTCGQS